MIEKYIADQYLSILYKVGKQLSSSTSSASTSSEAHNKKNTSHNTAKEKHNVSLLLINDYEKKY